jgi:hypothetical protein
VNQLAMPVGDLVSNSHFSKARRKAVIKFKLYQIEAARNFPPRYTTHNSKTLAAPPFCVWGLAAPQGLLGVVRHRLEVYVWVVASPACSGYCALQDTRWPANPASPAAWFRAPSGCPPRAPFGNSFSSCLKKILDFAKRLQSESKMRVDVMD